AAYQVPAGAPRTARGGSTPRKKGTSRVPFRNDAAHRGDIAANVGRLGAKASQHPFDQAADEVVLQADRERRAASFPEPTIDGQRRQTVDRSPQEQRRAVEVEVLPERTVGDAGFACIPHLLEGSDQVFPLRGGEL